MNFFGQNAVQIAQVEKPSVELGVAASQSPWLDRILYDPVNLISISLAIIAVILGIIPLILYVSERRKSRLLDETVKEFAILDRIRQMHAEEEKRGEISKAERDKIEAEARTMRE